MSALTTIQETPRVSLIAAMAGKYNMEPAAFQQTIKSTVMPSGATNEQMAAFLLVANEYDLNPITKEIHAFPAKGGGVTPVVGIDGWINLAQRRPEFDGMEHEWAHDEKGNPISCTCKIYRKDRTRPIVVTEFMDECRRPSEPWRTHPRRMLRHKATIQAIRYAFGFAGIKDEDDAEVIYANATVVEQKTPNRVSDLNNRLASGKGKKQPRIELKPEPESAPALELISEAEIVTDSAPEPDNDEEVTFDTVMNGIKTAPDAQTISEWWEESQHIVISESQRKQVTEERDKRFAAINNSDAPF